MGGDGHFGVAVRLDGIIEWLRGASITGDPYSGGNSDDDGENGGGGGALDPGGNNDIGTPGNLPTLNDNYCYGNGLGSTEWIMCPAIDNMRYTVSGLDQVIQSWLEVPEGNYDNTSAVPIVWDVMRNIANTMMIIVLVVIIFSQLTGYGIDNYGIKKMLPKLILMAVVINMSLIICQLAVDLSNILGVGLRNLFGSVGEAISNPDLRGDAFIGGAMAMILTGAGVVGAASGTALMIVTLGGGGAMALIIILLALAAILVAVLIFFVMLGARQVIVMLCVALAPIAFAMYILPNTQSLFKRWWKLFEAALVMFPICGALGGISMLVRGLLSNNSGSQVWEWVVAMLLPFLPFFLLPSLLRGALAALGQIGGAITAGLGALRGGANRAIDAGRGAVQGSERFKAAQGERARRMQERNAQRILQRTNGNLTDLQTRARGGDRRAQALLRRRESAQQTINQLTNEQERANAGATLELTPEMAARRAQSGIDAQRFKENQEEFAGYSKEELQQVADNAGSWLETPAGTQRMNALVQAMESQGLQKNIYEMLRRNNVSNNAGIMQSLANSSDKILKAYGKKGAGVDYSSFMSGTGDGTLQGYAQEKGSDFLNGLSDKSLAEIGRNGGVAMSDAQLMQAAASINGQDSVAEIDKMIGDRIRSGNTAGLRFSADQLSQFNDSTMKILATNARTDSNLQNAIVSASNKLTNEQISKMGDDNLGQVNFVREISGLGALGASVGGGGTDAGGAQNSDPTNGMGAMHGMPS